MNIGDVDGELQRMQAEMLEINELLETMKIENVGRRDEPAWNAWAISGGLYVGIGNLRKWVRDAIKDVTT
jgi:hypothetical protein